MTDLSLKILCESINSVPLFIKKNFYEMPFLFVSVSREILQ